LSRVQRQRRGRGQQHHQHRGPLRHDRLRRRRNSVGPAGSRARAAEQRREAADRRERQVQAACLASGRHAVRPHDQQAACK
jgi:hypothetical protein